MIAVSGTVSSVSGGQVTAIIQDGSHCREIQLKTRNCCNVRVVRGKPKFGSVRKGGIKTGLPIFVAVDSQGGIRGNWGPDPRKRGRHSSTRLTGQYSRRREQAVRRLAAA